MCGTVFRAEQKISEVGPHWWLTCCQDHANEGPFMSRPIYAKVSNLEHKPLNFSNQGQTLLSVLASKSP